MHSFLIFLFILSLLARVSTASAPYASLPSSFSSESIYSDSESLLFSCFCTGLVLCHRCRDSFQASPSIVEPETQMDERTFTDKILNHPEWAELDLHTTTVQNRRLEDNCTLNPQALQLLNQNATMLQDPTIRCWAQDTYNTGDRLQVPKAGKPASNRSRSPKRPRAYPCKDPGCEKFFDRHCEANRHFSRCHADRNKICHVCNIGFVYPKDLRRHLLSRRHAKVATENAQATTALPVSGPLDGLYISHASGTSSFPCEVDGCSATFTRRDNLRRHLRALHATSTSSP